MLLLLFLQGMQEQSGAKKAKSDSHRREMQGGSAGVDGNGNEGAAAALRHHLNGRIA